MTVVVLHLVHGGGGGWNISGMMIGSPIFRREHDRSLSHRRLAQAVADDERSLRLIRN
jgi:CHASE1-domain containing sensor protein